MSRASWSAHADDAALASGVTADRLRRAGRRRGRRARRRAGHARNRPARAAPHGRAHRRRGAVRRLGLRPRCRRPACRPVCASRAAALPIGDVRVPIVCGAVLFDLLNGGDKNWGRFPPYRDLGYAAAAAAGVDFTLGTAGAGFGATTVNLKGGLGSASAVTRDGHTVGALVAVNACGSVNVGDGPHFWAAPFELGRRVRRPRLSGDAAARGAESARQRRPGREHHHRHRRDRRRAHQGAGQAVRRDGAGRSRARDLSGAHDARRRHGVRGRDRPPAARDPSTSSPNSAPSPPMCSRARLRGLFEATALPGGLPSWQDCHS